ncbi:acyl-CoA thioesterase domain-containing protein [Mycobacterium sp. OTB74]|jgi:acyl-CoA thioesterase|uniref:acyl-CoA thioesterase n=1 Tax=Mycobacterium sp. OTB74 TaxID=1853452 RepID=UPI002473BD49|nr:acyl-CoA thioesterase domain-containing protein [Mycobacterium sp. OTB74]MDH6246752.1 acyl-CoA thioesterase-2 [Mycobacterium sp. OTB74]
MTSAGALHDELIAALTLVEQPDGALRAPYFTEGRGVVFGGQLLGQAIVAASRRLPDKRVKTLQMLFARGVSLTEPVDILVDPMHEGRNIGSATVSFVQNEQVCARALVLFDVAEPDLVRYQVPMPDVEAPDPAKAQPHPLTAPQTIVVGDVDVRDPALTGPASLRLWVRFPDAPDGAAVHRALVAHTTDGWLIATAMRPHAGLGQSMAHKEVSTGVLTQTLSFHGELDARGWLLIDHEVVVSRGGRSYGRGNIFAEDGTVVASFVQDALLRRFPQGQNSAGRQKTIF